MPNLPLFPLPGVVLFPGTLLPLHVFEPRYRALVADALGGERMIGMAMIDPAAPYADPPRLLPLGGAGRIVEEERLEDGRYNIVLEGAWRFRIRGEVPFSPYRIATVEPVPSGEFADASAEVAAVRMARSLFAELQPAMELPPLPDEAMSAERLSGELALRLRWSPPELQRVLETDSLPERFDAISSRLAAWKDAADML
ncbi:MAG TPA: LON peptidase substrate-binding domain-containing protein, partial [Thermoanaerobaculia bacterium]|nr:LON peptidase substrate-binding domain-containing protein [Thermoanaerobaculia bacterium]